MQGGGDRRRFPGPKDDAASQLLAGAGSLAVRREPTAAHSAGGRSQPLQDPRLREQRHQSPRGAGPQPPREGHLAPASARNSVPQFSTVTRSTEATSLQASIRAAMSNSSGVPARRLAAAKADEEVELISLGTAARGRRGPAVPSSLACGGAPLLSAAAAAGAAATAAPPPDRLGQSADHAAAPLHASAGITKPSYGLAVPFAVSSAVRPRNGPFSPQNSPGCSPRAGPPASGGVGSGAPRKVLSPRVQYGTACSPAPAAAESREDAHGSGTQAALPAPAVRRSVELRDSHWRAAQDDARAMANLLLGLSLVRRPLLTSCLSPLPLARCKYLELCSDAE